MGQGTDTADRGTVTVTVSKKAGEPASTAENTMSTEIGSSPPSDRGPVARRPSLSIAAPEKAHREYLLALQGAAGTGI